MTDTNAAAKAYTFEELAEAVGDTPRLLRARLRHGDTIEVTVTDDVYYITDDAIADYKDRKARASADVAHMLDPETVKAARRRLIAQMSGVDEDTAKRLGY